MQMPTSVPVTTTVSHAPSVNFSNRFTTRMKLQTTKQMTAMASGRRHSAWRFCVSARRQYRIMPSWLSAKVTKTLIAYITTSASTEPRV